MGLTGHKAVAQNTTGDVVGGVAVEVRTDPGDVLATLFTDAGGGTGVTNPFTADATTGVYEFYTDPDRYSVLIGTGPSQVSQPLDLVDATWLDQAVTTTSDVTFAGLTSTGIDDNATSTAITIDSAGIVDIAGEYLTIGGNELGAEQQTIADDAVGSFIPPRDGGFALITCNGDTNSPIPSQSSVVFYDIGNSLFIEEAAAWTTVGQFVDTSTSDVSGTTGTDGFTTIAVQSGVLKIENRVGSSKTYQVTFL